MKRPLQHGASVAMQNTQRLRRSRVILLTHETSTLVRRRSNDDPSMNSSVRNLPVRGAYFSNTQFVRDVPNMERNTSCVTKCSACPEVCCFLSWSFLLLSLCFFSLLFDFSDLYFTLLFWLIFPLLLFPLLVPLWWFQDSTTRKFLNLASFDENWRVQSCKPPVPIKT